MRGIEEDEYEKGLGLCASDDGSVTASSLPAAASHGLGAALSPLPRRSSPLLNIDAKYSDFKQDFSAKVAGSAGSVLRPAQRCHQCGPEKQM